MGGFCVIQAHNHRGESISAHPFLYEMSPGVLASETNRRTTGGTENDVLGRIDRISESISET